MSIALIISSFCASSFTAETPTRSEKPTEVPLFSVLGYVRQNYGGLVNFELACMAATKVSQGKKRIHLATVTSAPARLRTSIMMTASISSDPLAMGIKTLLSAAEAPSAAEALCNPEGGTNT